VKDKHELKRKPFFIISWQYALTEKEEMEIRSQLDLAEGLDLDTDVYLTFLRCTNATETSNANQTESTNTTKAFSFVTKVSVPFSMCEYQIAEIRFLEFYSVREQNFIEPVDLHSGMTLIQKVIRRTNLKRAILSTVAAQGYPFRAKFSKTNDSFESGYEADQVQFLGESFNLS
jgi:hypothetical protein